MIKLINLIKEIIGLINEELIGEINGDEVYKNPKSIKRFEAECRAISFPNGDLFVVDNGWSIIHTEFAKWLNSNGYSIRADGTNTTLVDNIKKGYVAWQRVGKTSTFRLSKSINFYNTEYFNKKELMPYLKKSMRKVKQKNPTIKFELVRIDD